MSFITIHDALTGKTPEVLATTTICTLVLVAWTNVADVLRLNMVDVMVVLRRVLELMLELVTEVLKLEMAELEMLVPELLELVELLVLLEVLSSSLSDSESFSSSFFSSSSLFCARSILRQNFRWRASSQDFGAAVGNGASTWGSP